jgi:hypothetical protein
MIDLNAAQHFVVPGPNGPEIYSTGFVQPTPAQQKVIDDQTAADQAARDAAALKDAGMSRAARDAQAKQDAKDEAASTKAHR